MTDLTIAALVTRQNVAGGPLADLDINDHDSYDLVSWGPGTVAWVWDWASAPSVHGEQPVSGRMGNATAPIAIRVKAGTKALYEARALALVAAFQQIRFNVKFTTDAGATENWKCYAADITPAAPDGSTSDGSWHMPSLMTKYQQVFHLQVPRAPIPVSGVL